MSSVALAEVPLAEDLQRDAARYPHAPVLLFFAAEGCPFCATVEEDYLLPMLEDRKMAGKVVIRKIDVDDRSSRLKDFSGRETTHHAFATRLRITLTPTLRLVGPDGRDLVEAIVGFNTPEFFGGRLNNAIEEAGGLLRRRAIGCRPGQPRC